jgi:hypothetical protein
MFWLLPTFIVTMFCISAYIPCDNVLHIGLHSLWQCSDYWLHSLWQCSAYRPTFLVTMFWLLPTFLVTMFWTSAYITSANVLHISLHHQYTIPYYLVPWRFMLFVPLVTLLLLHSTMVWSPSNQINTGETTNDNSHNKHSAPTGLKPQNKYLFLTSHISTQ